MMVSAKVLIAGHSQTKYFKEYITDENVDVMSFSGFRVEEFWKQISPVVRKYEVIVLHIGINNIPRDNAANILAKYQMLVENIWKTNARAFVFTSGILPRVGSQFKAISRDFLTNVNQTAGIVNRSLFKISQLLPRKLGFVGHPAFGNNGKINEQLLSRDGLHLTFPGTQAVATRC